MGGTIKTAYGKAELFRNNPRTMREGQFNALCESMEAHPQFMAAQKIVLWQVPTEIEAAEGEKCPFEGQGGRLIVLSGNQRVKGLLAQGMDSIPDDWCCEAKDADGNWWHWRDAEIFVNLANSPSGLAGDFDYGALQAKFDEFRMRQAGIDFSNFTEAMAAGTFEPKGEDAIAEEAEGDGLHGEMNEELEAFIAEREKTRKALKEIDETGFHLLLVFPGGVEEKCEFIRRAGVFGGAVSVDGSQYLDLVFESYAQKKRFLEESHLEEDDPETGVPPVMAGLFCDGRAFARKMGVRLEETGLHFRDRIVDGQLAEMAMGHEEQKSEGEIQEEIYARLKAERRGLGMSDRSPGERRKKGADSEAEGGAE